MNWLDKQGSLFIILTGQIFLIVLATAYLGPECDKKIHIILAGLLFYTIGIIIIEFIEGRNNDIEERVLNICRMLRHDFQNRLQVLHCMIQLKKYEGALEYIKDLKDCDRIVNHICYNLNDIRATCHLLEMFYYLRQKNINTAIEILDENPRLPNFSYLKREVENFVLQLDKIQGEKNIRITLKSACVEILSNTVDEKVILKPNILHKLYT